MIFIALGATLLFIGVIVMILGIMTDNSVLFWIGMATSLTVTISYVLVLLVSLWYYAATGFVPPLLDSIF